MSAQPKALRLADKITGFYSAWDIVAAADELRRLHAVNAELLEALTDLLGWQTLAPDDVVAAARAAIAKAEGVKP